MTRSDLTPASFPARLQVVAYGVLVAEVIAPIEDMDRIRAGYINAKVKAGKPVGGLSMARADLPRLYDVPVGGCVRCGADLVDAPHDVRCEYSDDYYEPSHQLVGVSRVGDL